MPEPFVEILACTGCRVTFDAGPDNEWGQITGACPRCGTEYGMPCEPGPGGVNRTSSMGFFIECDRLLAAEGGDFAAGDRLHFEYVPA